MCDFVLGVAFTLVMEFLLIMLCSILIGGNRK